MANTLSLRESVRSLAHDGVLDKPDKSCSMSLRAPRKMAPASTHHGLKLSLPLSKLLLRLREHPIFDPAANVKDKWSAKRTLADVDTSHSLLEVP